MEEQEDSKSKYIGLKVVKEVNKMARCALIDVEDSNVIETFETRIQAENYVKEGGFLGDNGSSTIDEMSECYLVELNYRIELVGRIVIT